MDKLRVSTGRVGLALVFLVVTGCSLVKLRDEASTFYASAILVGRVENAASPAQPVVVAAWQKRAGRIEIVHATRLHEPGAYELIVPMGRFHLFAFADSNGNQRYDAGEATGAYLGKPNGEVEVKPELGGVIAGLDFALSLAPSASAETDLPPGTALLGLPSAPPHSTQIGAPLRFDDPRFSADAGRRGYWTPVEFYRELGGNVYFLEPYDPRKIPILFVHGAQGSPRDWQAMVDSLDRSRYQPWFFYYPSGAAVESMAQLLYWKLLNLQMRYGFPRLYLTAHSMGGLVLESFLENFGTQFPQIQLFVSIATPWSGDAAAESGVRYSPAVVPSWEDMRPEGRFQRSLFTKPLPPNIPYYLFFAHHGSPGLWRPNNDGSVTLASQLRPAAQASARQVFGFDEGHVGVLRSPELLQRYNALLSALDRPTAAGSLRVQLKRSETAQPAPIAFLVMTPLAAGQVPILAPLDQGREIGALAPGRYRVSVFSHGYRSEPAWRELEVADGQVSELEFGLRPATVLAGYFAEPIRSGAQPAGQFRRLEAAVKLREVSLEGPSGQRRLLAVADGGEATVARYLADEDYAYEGGFSFVGLSPGRHTLSIVSDRGRTIRRTVELSAEGGSLVLPIELERD